jgi:hypothetical protein
LALPGSKGATQRLEFVGDDEPFTAKKRTQQEPSLAKLEAVVP